MHQHQSHCVSPWKWWLVEYCLTLFKKWLLAGLWKEWLCIYNYDKADEEYEGDWWNEYRLLILFIIIIIVKWQYYLFIIIIWQTYLFTDRVEERPTLIQNIIVPKPASVCFNICRQQTNRFRMPSGSDRANAPTSGGGGEQQIPQQDWEVNGPSRRNHNNHNGQGGACESKFEGKCNELKDSVYDVVTWSPTKIRSQRRLVR
jgi:hypothetical protein